MEVEIVVVVFEPWIDVLTSDNVAPVGVLASFTVVLAWTTEGQEGVAKNCYGMRVSKFHISRILSVRFTLDGSFYQALVSSRFGLRLIVR